MIKFFKPEDFGAIYLDSAVASELVNQKLNKETIDVSKTIAQCALRYFDIHIDQRQLDGFSEYLSERFILLSKPAPCTHPKEKVSTGTFYNGYTVTGTNYYCACGKTVKPSSFEEK
jgi:hypothetical protein